MKYKPTGDEITTGEIIKHLVINAVLVATAMAGAFGVGFVWGCGR